MALDTTASGTGTDSRKVRANNSGSTDPFMRATGVRIRLMVVVDSSMLMEMYTMESGRTTRLMALDATITPTVPSMKVTGMRTSSTDAAKRSGPTVLSMRVTTTMERNTAKESSTGLMAPPTPEILKTTTSKAKESTLGLTVVSSLASGT